MVSRLALRRATREPRLYDTTNRLFIVGIVTVIALLLTLIYVLPLRRIFGLAPLAPEHWLLLLTFGPLLLLFEECRKALRRRFVIAPLSPAPVAVVNRNNFQGKKL
jgi:magnesium-transporting ATPase (P-type)